jgi:phosphonate transport system permease protein
MTLLEREELADLRWEGLAVPSTGGRPRAIGLWPRRRWLGVLALLVGWSLFDALRRPGGIVNPGGWAQVADFVSAALRPELDAEFLRTVLSAVGTTVGYALVGTALALVIGVLGGVLTSGTLWLRDPLAAGSARPRAHPGRWVVRVGAGTARGIHEAVWALVLLMVLGRDPWVAVLAIGVPFGAVTAKVVADLLDDAPIEPVRALRAAGAGRLAAMAYGLGPTVLPDLVSYAFYRFECALRSSVVLGMIGAGGIGFELSQSFQSLRYREIWTLIYALCALALVVDRWGASLRGRSSPGRARFSFVAAIAATAVAAWWLELRPGSLFDGRTRRLFGDLVSEAIPPRLPAGGGAELAEAFVDTVQMSVIAIALAAAFAVPLAFVAARPDHGGRLVRLVGAVLRVVLLVMRTLPPPLWAFVVLFVVFPGPLPGGIALGLYTIGVLGRLCAETVENADSAPTRALRTAGASTTTAFAYGTVPVVAPRFVSLALYRWEVVLRETVVVGLVGAGGLGRLLAQQNAAFDEPRMLTTIAALIVAGFAVDVVSGRVRAALR